MHCLKPGTHGNIKYTLKPTKSPNFSRACLIQFHHYASANVTYSRLVLMLALMLSFPPGFSDRIAGFLSIMSYYSSNQTLDVSSERSWYEETDEYGYNRFDDF